jgi:hypothetical protein
MRRGMRRTAPYPAKPRLSGARIHPFRAQNTRVLRRDRLGDVTREYSQVAWGDKAFGPRIPELATESALRRQQTFAGIRSYGWSGGLSPPGGTEKRLHGRIDALISVPREGTWYPRALRIALFAVTNVMLVIS